MRLVPRGRRHHDEGGATANEARAALRPLLLLQIVQINAENVAPTENKVIATNGRTTIKR